MCNNATGAKSKSLAVAGSQKLWWIMPIGAGVQITKGNWAPRNIWDMAFVLTRETSAEDRSVQFKPVIEKEVSYQIYTYMLPVIINCFTNLITVLMALRNKSYVKKAIFRYRGQTAPENGYW